MNEKAKEVKRSVLESINNAVGELFKESAEAEQLVYKDHTGIEARECPGAYSPLMTSCMARDILSLGNYYMIHKDEKTMKTVFSWSEKLKERDLYVRRMFDDRKDKREVMEYPFDDTTKIIEEMTELAKNGLFEDECLESCKEASKAWATRFLKLEIWAYYLKAREALDEFDAQVEMQGYDGDGNLVYGISDEDKECVKILIAMAQFLLQAFVRVPANSDQIQPTMGRFEIITAFLKAIIEGDTETLDRLDRTAEGSSEESP